MRFERFKKNLDILKAHLLVASSKLHSMEVSESHGTLLQCQLASGEIEITTLVFKMDCEVENITRSGEA